MEYEDIAKTSAALHFDLPEADFTILMRIRGEPDYVRKALRAACSHRRSIIIVHSNEYFSNVVYQLGKLALDNIRVFAGVDKFHAARRECHWVYRMDIFGQRQTPYLHFHSQGKDETHVALFQFLGTEIKRAYERTPGRRRSPGGRPKESWLRDALFRRIEMAPAKRAWYEKIYAARQKRESDDAKLAKGIPLDLKKEPQRSHKKKKNTVAVDMEALRNTPLPNPRFNETLRDLEEAAEEMRRLEEHETGPL